MRYIYIYTHTCHIHVQQEEARLAREEANFSAERARMAEVQQGAEPITAVVAISEAPVENGGWSHGGFQKWGHPQLILFRLRFSISTIHPWFPHFRKFPHDS